jgi:hypothetical protein
MAEAQPTVTYREIPGFPGYRIGDDGSVWSNRGRNGRAGSGWRRIRTDPDPGTGGYCRVALCAGGMKNLYVHRLVLQVFVGPCPEGMEACHNDGNRANNRLANLRWDTHQSNVDDMRAHGTHRQGAKMHLAKLTDEIVLAIRAEYAAGGVTHRQLARKFGVAKTAIHNVLNRQTWRHV